MKAAWILAAAALAEGLDAAFVFVGMIQRLMPAGGTPEIQDISQRASWPLIDGK